MPFSWKLIGIGIVLAAIGSLIWREHIVVQQRNKALAENLTLTATIVQERENTRKANEASAKYQADLSSIRDERRNTPDPVVRMCRKPPSVPAASDTSGPSAAAEGNNAEADAGDNQEGPDIGKDLMDFAQDCEENASQLKRLQDLLFAR